MKEKSFESRRVRTQPCTNTSAIGAELCKASLTEVGESMAGNSPTIVIGQAKGSPIDASLLRTPGVGDATLALRRAKRLQGARLSATVRPPPRRPASPSRN